MKPLQVWLDEYAESHQNPTNKAIHYLCVPVIFFTIIGLLMSIPPVFLQEILPTGMAHWATIAMVFAMIFYLRLSFLLALKMFVFAMACIMLNQYLSNFIPIFTFSITVFAIAWIGQFYGHHVEGKKPSFFKDLQFLLIGPAWVMNKIF